MLPKVCYCFGSPPGVGWAKGADMHVYGMMEYGGWMFLWWIGGLFLLGAVIYTAVRLGSRGPRREDCYHDPYACDRRRDEDRYHRNDDRYRGDAR